MHSHKHPSRAVNQSGALMVFAEVGFQEVGLQQLTEA